MRRIKTSKRKSRTPIESIAFGEVQPGGEAV